MSVETTPTPEGVLHKFDEPIYVTRAFMPPFEEYMELMRGVWERGHVTNQGPLLTRFEQELDKLLGTNRSIFMVNGTIALHLAIRALDLDGEVITTAFTHPVTSTSLMWEGCELTYVDVDPGTFCIDPSRIEERITDRTQAIMATHVYGIPCDVKAIEKIAEHHGLKVIYDGAHALGTKVDGRSVLTYGDISTTSYHATKIFQTVEGGSIHTQDDELYERLLFLRTMGQRGEEFFMPGVNAKNSEMHAAMGVANLKYYDAIMAKRGQQWQLYFCLLHDGRVELAQVPQDIEYNHSYFPVVFKSEEELVHVRKVLNEANVFPRRYFRPAATLLPFVDRAGESPIAESLSARVLCLPLYHDLENSSIERIVHIIHHALTTG